MREPDLSRSSSILGELQGPGIAGSEHFLLYGATKNEGTVQYQHGVGAHQIVVLERMSSDAVVAHQMRVTAAHYRLGSLPELQPTPRRTRELLLRNEAPLVLKHQGPLSDTQSITSFGVQDVVVLPPAPGAPDGSFGVSNFGQGGFGG